jgi:hypothetical protein
MTIKRHFRFSECLYKQNFCMFYFLCHTQWLVSHINDVSLPDVFSADKNFFSQVLVATSWEQYVFLLKEDATPCDLTHMTVALMRSPSPSRPLACFPSVPCASTPNHSYKGSINALLGWEIWAIARGKRWPKGTEDMQVRRMAHRTMAVCKPINFLHLQKTQTATLQKWKQEEGSSRLLYSLRELIYSLRRLLLPLPPKFRCRILFTHTKHRTLNPKPKILYIYAYQFFTHIFF